MSDRNQEILKRRLAGESFAGIGKSLASPPFASGRLSNARKRAYIAQPSWTRRLYWPNSKCVASAAPASRHAGQGVR
jgi:hypothetical protein